MQPRILASTLICLNVLSVCLTKLVAVVCSIKFPGKGSSHLIKNRFDTSQSLLAALRPSQKGSNIKQISKGFGIQSEKKIAVTSDDSTSRQNSGSNLKDDKDFNRLNIMENNIQRDIDSISGLRESMDLHDDIVNWRILQKGTSQPSANSEEINIKVNRRQELETSLGWSDKKIQSKLQEITWDNAAKSRTKRHNEESISSGMHTFMVDTVAKWVLSGKSVSSKGENVANVICDVGTGNGILINFLRECYRVNKLPFQETAFTGVDLSSQMIMIAQANYPAAQFVYTNFLDFNSARYDICVMNECLHNFDNIGEVLQHAAMNVLKEGAGGRIVISNPKGYSNIVMQYSKNRWLSPSLLPSTTELASIAQQINCKVVESPNTNDRHYFAVLEKL